MKALMKTVFAGVALAGLAGCVISIGGSERVDVSHSGKSCNIAKHQSLIGQPAASIVRETLPKSFRIVCAGCPMTMDYNSDRLTIQLDAANRVESVSCT